MEYPSQISLSSYERDRLPTTAKLEAGRKKRTGPGTVEYLWEENEGRRLDGKPEIETKQEDCMRIRRQRSSKRSHAQVDFLHPTRILTQLRKKVTCRSPTPTLQRLQHIPQS